MTSSTGKTTNFDLLARLNEGHVEPTTIWEPEEFFLKALSNRLAQVVEEWRCISEYLNGRILKVVSNTCDWRFSIV